jgi:hypothetical protein
MMYAPTPEAVWNLFISEILTMGTLLYLLGTVAFFAMIILVLEFLDSTRTRK